MKRLLILTICVVFVAGICFAALANNGKGVGPSNKDDKLTGQARAREAHCANNGNSWAHGVEEPEQTEGIQTTTEYVYIQGEYTDSSGEIFTSNLAVVSSVTRVDLATGATDKKTLTYDCNAGQVPCAQAKEIEYVLATGETFAVAQTHSHYESNVYFNDAGYHLDFDGAMVREGGRADHSFGIDGYIEISKVIAMMPMEGEFTEYSRTCVEYTRKPHKLTIHREYQYYKFALGVLPYDVYDTNWTYYPSGNVDQEVTQDYINDAITTTTYLEDDGLLISGTVVVTDGLTGEQISSASIEYTNLDGLVRKKNITDDSTGEVQEVVTYVYDTTNDNLITEVSVLMD